jgi:hypothetical protein
MTLVSDKISKIASKQGCTQEQISDILLSAGEYSIASDGKLMHGSERGKRFIKGPLRAQKPHLFPETNYSPAGVKVDPRKNCFCDDSPAGEGRRIAAIKALGAKACAGLALAAGRTITGQPLRK